ncbi:fasciclin domain-containing protein [Rhodobacterales bacterium LSUCC0387]|nr:fasciclin domain-containing protein [Rhodobacterales bacterium LSUCC0387]
MGHAKDIVDTVAAACSFTTLLATAEAAGPVETLKGEGPLTVFAPEDEAFTALPEGTVETLLLPQNRDQLVAILTYHVIAGAVMSGDLSEGMTAANVLGAGITIYPDNGMMPNDANDANVVTSEIEALNGVIHVIDKVIMPPM